MRAERSQTLAPDQPSKPSKDPFEGFERRWLCTEQCLDMLAGVEAELAGACRLAEPEPSAAERAAWTTAAATLVEALHPARPRGDATAKRWRQFCADPVRFAKQGWLHRARAAGWSMLELFGGDQAVPFARVDCAGLILLLNGNEVVWITGRAAVIAPASCKRNTDLPHSLALSF